MKTSTVLGYLAVGILGVAVERSTSLSTSGVGGVPLTELRVRAAVLQWRQETPIRDYVGIKVHRAFDQTIPMDALKASSGGLDQWRTYRAVLYPTDE